MADELTATGLTIDSLEDRIAAVNALVRAAISPNLDLSPDQPTGQLIRILCERTQSVLEVARAVHAGSDPRNASGDALTAVSLLTGTVRRPATYGTVTLTCNLDGGTVLPAGTVAHVAGDAENRWASDVAFTAPLGAPAGYPIAATCTEDGPIQALAGTISVRATTVPGWNSVTNAATAAEGDAEETDAALRQRREDELAIGGSTSVDAIRAEVLDLDGIISCLVLENDYDYTVGGIPPHATEVIIWDNSPPAAVDAEIAEAIWTSKASGVQPWGLTDTAVHVDAQEQNHVVAWTRATALRIIVTLDVNVDADFIGAPATSAYIAAQALAFFTVGTDVYRSRISDWAMDCLGVYNVVAGTVLISIWPGAPGAFDLALTTREIATIDAADVTVTVV